MKLVGIISLLFALIGSASIANADECFAPGFMLYKAKVEAQVCDLQIDIVLASIEKHQAIGNAEKEICFDIGQLTTYIKLLDLAVDEAKDDLKNESWETRYYFRLPFRMRDNLLGACGIIVDATMPVGDYNELRKRLFELRRVLQKIK